MSTKQIMMMRCALISMAIISVDVPEAQFSLMMLRTSIGLNFCLARLSMAAFSRMENISGKKKNFGKSLMKFCGNPLS